MPYIEVNFSVGMQFPRWVEKIQDYVWPGGDDDADDE